MLMILPLSPLFHAYSSGKGKVSHCPEFPCVPCLPPRAQTGFGVFLYTLHALNTSPGSGFSFCSPVLWLAHTPACAHTHTLGFAWHVCLLCGFLHFLFFVFAKEILHEKL